MINITIYLLIANKYFEQQTAFQIIERIVYNQLNDKKELSLIGKQSLKIIIEPYQDKSSSKITDANIAIDEVKLEMKKNITQTLDNLDDVKDLEKKATEIHLKANQYKDSALDLKKLACMRNARMTIIIIVAVILLLLIIIIPIAVTNSNAAEKVVKGAENSTLSKT